MTAITRPDVRLFESWADTVLDFGSTAMDGSGDWQMPEEIRRSVTRDACGAWVEELLRAGDPAVPLQAGHVRCDYLWITDGDAGAGSDTGPGTGGVVGFIALRHELNDFLLNQGGHVGYSVRPSRRREGHASKALRLCLARAGELGIEQALLTCDEDNLASATTIEHAGGIFEDTRRGKRRYWIPTAAASDGVPPSPR